MKTEGEGPAASAAGMRLQRVTSGRESSTAASKVPPSESPENVSLELPAARQARSTSRATNRRYRSWAAGSSSNSVSKRSQPDASNASSHNCESKSFSSVNFAADRFTPSSFRKGRVAYIPTNHCGCAPGRNRLPWPNDRSARPRLALSRRFVAEIDQRPILLGEFRHARLEGLDLVVPPSRVLGGAVGQLIDQGVAEAKSAAQLPLAVS